MYEQQKFLRHYFHYFGIPKNAYSSMMPKRRAAALEETAKTTENKTISTRWTRLISQATEIPPPISANAHLQMRQIFWPCTFPRLTENPARAIKTFIPAAFFQPGRVPDIFGPPFSEICPSTVKIFCEHFFHHPSAIWQ